jgi:transcriptional regulator with XRE-family HTH domain
MKLKDFLKKTGKTQAEFAKELGLAENTVSRYVSAGRVPLPKIMQKIKELTGGKVTPNDFIQG